MNQIEPIQKIETAANGIVQTAQLLEIKNDKQRAAGAQLNQDIKALQKEIHDTFDPVCDSTHKAWKAAVAARDKHLEPLIAAKKLIDSKTGAYVQALEDARLKALQAAQAKAEAEEREKRRVEAEIQRRASEMAAKAAVAEAARLKKAGDAAAAKRLKEEEARRQAEEARRAAELAAAPIVVAVAAPEPVAKVAGQSTSTDYNYVLVDKSKLPLEFLIPDEVAILKTVKALKENAEKIIPGIKVVTKIRITTR